MARYENNWRSIDRQFAHNMGSNDQSLLSLGSCKASLVEFPIPMLCFTSLDMFRVRSKAVISRRCISGNAGIFRGVLFWGSIYDKYYKIYHN